MIKVRFVSNGNATTKIVDENTTLLKSIEDAGFDTNKIFSVTAKDGFSGFVSRDDLARSFKDIGASGDVLITSVEKTANA